MTAALDEIDDEIIATLSDYFDDALPEAKKREVEEKLKSDATWKRAHDEMLDTSGPSALSGLQKAHAPATFAEDVTSTIHQRSAGRFFGPRAFNDRLPLIPLLVVALLLIGIVAYVLRGSQTGSLKMHTDAPPTQQGSAVIDKP